MYLVNSFLLAGVWEEKAQEANFTWLLFDYNAGVLGGLECNFGCKLMFYCTS